MKINIRVDLTKMAVMPVSKLEQTSPTVVWQSDIVKPLSLSTVHQVLQPKKAEVKMSYK